MSSFEYNQPGNMVASEDPQSLAPRSTGASMDDLIAMMASQFPNGPAATAAARNWRPVTGEPNYVTSTVAPVGGHRRNHVGLDNQVQRRQKVSCGTVTHSESHSRSLEGQKMSMSEDDIRFRGRWVANMEKMQQVYLNSIPVKFALGIAGFKNKSFHLSTTWRNHRFNFSAKSSCLSRMPFLNAGPSTMISGS
ncbi:hypothetical protein BGZ58_005213, partial [Dissophora ornata]